MFDTLKRLTPLQATVLLVATTTLLRLFAAKAVGLSVDEAHYALYGLHLDWSYFDHPPLIGWLQALVLQFGDSDFALRALPIFLFACTSMVLHQVSLVLFPRETPWLAFSSVALLHSGVMFQLVGLAMLPDTPLLLLGLLVLWVLHDIMVKGRVRYWLWLGVLLGLAALSKYTAITLVATVVLALAGNRQWRQLRSPWPWLAVLAATLLILPILYWNYSHDWISFAYQLQHGAGKPSWELRRFLAAQGAQLIVYGPGLFVFGLIAAVYGLRQRRDRGAWLCLSLALPVLLLFGWGAGFEMTLPHWTALAWAGLAPLTAYWLHRHSQRRWVRVGVGAALVYSGVVLAVVFGELLFSWLPFKDNGNPMRDLYGWEQAAQRAGQLRGQMELEQAGSTPKLFTENWTYASRLAWYARPAPVQVADTRYDQFDLWFGSPQNEARGILVLWPDQQATPAVGGVGQFTACELRDRLPVSAHGHLISTFSFYACHGYRN